MGHFGHGTPLPVSVISAVHAFYLKLKVVRKNLGKTPQEKSYQHHGSFRPHFDKLYAQFYNLQAYFRKLVTEFASAIRFGKLIARLP